MKICEKCGAYNSDNRMFCVDCNEKLNDNDNENLQQDVKSKIDELYNKKDPLHVSTVDKVFGYISILGVVATKAVFFFNCFKEKSCEYLGWALIAFAVTIFEAFCARTSWEFEKMRLSFRVNGSSDLEPSDFYIIRRKIAIIIATLLGILMLVINLLQ